MRLILALALAFVAATACRAEDFVFETSTARLVIGSDGLASSLTEKQNGKEQLHPQGLPFAAARKGGHLFSASAVERRGGLFHVTFGTLGRLRGLPHHCVGGLHCCRTRGSSRGRHRRNSAGAAQHALGKFGRYIARRQWDDEFAVSLMGLSEQVDSKIAGSVTSASVYPEFSMQGQRVAIIAAPTPQFLETVQKVEHDFQLPSPTIGGTWTKLSVDIRTSYLFTDLTEANADETIRYAKMAGFRYILIYSTTWSASLGSYPINPASFPHGEAGLKSVIDKCHAAGLKVGMHMLTSLVGKNDPLVRPKPNPGLLKDGYATLSTDVSEQATELKATPASASPGFPVQAASSDLVIDDEIIHCGQIKDVEFSSVSAGLRGRGPAAQGWGEDPTPGREGRCIPGGSAITARGDNIRSDRG